MIAQKDVSWANMMFLRQFDYRLIGKQRTTRTAERAVGRNEDTLRLAELYNFLLRQQRMILDLVDSRHNISFRQQFFEERLAEVCHPNRLRFASLQQLFHLLVSLDI